LVQEGQLVGAHCKIRETFSLAPLVFDSFVGLAGLLIRDGGVVVFVAGRSIHLGDKPPLRGRGGLALSSTATRPHRHPPQPDHLLGGGGRRPRGSPRIETSRSSRVHRQSASTASVSALFAVKAVASSVRPFG
jgi:hypothetical protein